MGNKVFKIFFILVAFLMLTPFVKAAVPSQFENLTSCQLSTNPSVLTSTCSNVQPPNMAMPDLYDGTDATKYDSPFGAKYFRITTPAGPVAENPLVNSMKPNYAKTPAWNSDGSKLWVFDNKGALQLFDGKTYTWIERITSAKNWQYDGQDNEPRWSHSDPNVIYYVSGMKFNSYNISTHINTTIHTFTDVEVGGNGLLNIHNGDEGNPDDSDRYWVFYAQIGSPNYTQQVIFTYDKQTDTVIAHKDYNVDGMCGTGVACPGGANWVGMDHSGNHVIVQWNQYGTHGVLTGERGKGTESFDRNLNFIAKLSDDNNHADLAQTADGTDIYAGSAWQTATNGYNAKRIIRVSDGAWLRSCMFPNQLSGSHTSGRTDSSLFKGWILVSTYDQMCLERGITSDGGIFALEAFALNIDTCEVRRIAHTQSNFVQIYSQRADSTAYAQGTYKEWSSGTTVWKVVTAGTTGPSAPDIAGKNIGDTVTDGSVVWELRSMINSDYYAEPHASMNFDFTKIIWGSNWRQMGGLDQAYVAELPFSSPSDTTAPASPTGLSVQ